MRPSSTFKCRRCKLVQYADVPIPEPVVVREWPEVLPTAAELEMQLIQEALRRSGGSRQKAARLIGIGKTTVHRKLGKVGKL